MTISQVDDAIDRAQSAMKSGLLTQAFMEGESLLVSMNASWQLRENLEHARKDFSLLKQYALDGFPDDSRESLMKQIVDAFKQTLTLARREFLLPNSYNIYYTTLRTLKASGVDGISSLVKRYEKMLSEQSLAEFNFARSSDVSVSNDLDSVELDLFNSVWTYHPLDEESVETLSSFLANTAVPTSSKRLIMSAIFLGGLEFYAPERMKMLVNACMDSDGKTAALALVNVLLLLWRWRHSTTFDTEELKVLFSLPEIRKRIRQIQFQLIRTQDTDRINKKMNDEILPQMMKLKPGIEKLNDIMRLDPETTLEENPRWEELLNESGLGEQLKELNDMQLEGADLAMAPVSHLKSMPFFHHVRNWFLSFDSKRAQLPSSALAMTEFKELIGNSPMLCDSDKYSIVLSVSSMPADMAKMIKRQIEESNLSMCDIISESATTDIERFTLNYIRDIYRFFKLYRRKADFNNPFEQLINFSEVDVLKAVIDDADYLRLIGEFYFSHGYWDSALRIFTILDDVDANISEEILQKTGYCHEKLGDTANALSAYEKADLLNGRNTWTLRRMGHCLRALGRNEEAAKVFGRLLKSMPDDVAALMNYGHCCLALGNYAEALNSYFKIEFIEPGTPTTLRPIAWCCFLSNDLSRARKYYQKIAEEDLTATDNLNFGHLEMASGSYRSAVKRYRLALEAMNRDTKRFFVLFAADRPILERFAVSASIIDLVLDEVNNLLWQ